MLRLSPFLASSLNLTQILIVASTHHQCSLCQLKWGQSEPTKCQDWWQSDQWGPGTDIVKQDWWSGSLPRITNHLQQVTNNNIVTGVIHWFIIKNKGRLLCYRGRELFNHNSLIYMKLRYLTNVCIIFHKTLNLKFDGFIFICIKT